MAHALLVWLATGGRDQATRRDVLAIALAFAAAILSYYFVERPFLRRKRQPEASYLHLVPEPSLSPSR